MLDKIIELFSHNEEAYESLVNSLKEYPLAFIEHATGTGKTFIILKYLYNFMRHKRILFVTKHDEMFDQLFGPQMYTLGIDRKDFKQFDTMIYHNIIKYDMKKLAEKYDCIIFDEAHHCGATEWGKKVLELKDLILKSKDKVMIGLTATGIRYLDDYMDVSEVFFDGHVASRLPVSKSILKELLPAPLYINSLRACKNKVDKVLTKLNKVPRNNDTISLNEEVMELNNQIEEQSSVGDLLKKYGVKPGEKYIVFCSSIKDLENKMKEAEDWFKDIGEVKMFQAHSSQKKATNRKEINEFSKNRSKVSLMFAVDIFNEGFHIDNVDGVLMFRKTQSPIIYLQQLGRALAFSLRHKQIKIFDFVDNISNNDVVRELYKEIVSVARKMIEEEPDKREFYENILKRFEIVDYTTNIMQRLEEIEKHLDETYTYRKTISAAIMKLREYRERYPEGDIARDIERRQISYDYIKAYNYLINVDDYLSLANIEELQELNINFDNKIVTDVNIRKKLLKGFDNFLELKNHELDTFVKDYINFYEEHNHRPSISTNKEENVLYELYRRYLTSLGKNKLSHILNNFPFKLSVEEVILTGSYPIKEEIDEYLNYLCDKIKQNQTLDKVEVRVLKRLRNTISMNNYELINYLEQKKI